MMHVYHPVQPDDLDTEDNLRNSLGTLFVHRRRRSALLLSSKMDQVPLRDIETGNILDFNAVLRTVVDDISQKIYREAVDEVDVRFSGTSEARKTAAKESLRVLSNRTALAENQSLAKKLQKQVAYGKKSLVIQAVNRLYPRDIEKFGPWGKETSKKADLKANDLECAVNVFKSLAPFVWEIQQSAKGSFFESIPYICYVVVVYSLLVFPDASTIEWWREKQNCVLLLSWAHQAVAAKDKCNRIWSGIDLLFEGQNITYDSFDIGTTMFDATKAVEQTCRDIDRELRQGNRSDSSQIVEYTDRDVNDLIELVRDVDPKIAEKMQIRHDGVKTTGRESGTPADMFHQRLRRCAWRRLQCGLR